MTIKYLINVNKVGFKLKCFPGVQYYLLICLFVNFYFLAFWPFTQPASNNCSKRPSLFVVYSLVVTAVILFITREG